MVVRDGAPKPDISSVDALKETLLHAKSIAYSDSASGVYIERELFKRLGIEDQVKGKAKMVPKIPVASVVANGDYEVGFQQVSELLPVQGVTFVGKIPESVQSVTRYAAGIPVGAQHPAGSESAARLPRLARRASRGQIDRTRLGRYALKTSPEQARAQACVRSRRRLHAAAFFFAVALRRVSMIV